MDYVNATTLTPKVGNGRVNKGISLFIRNVLNNIPAGKAVSLKTLASQLEDEFELPKNQTYVRINMILKRKGFEHLTKGTNAENDTFIVNPEV